MEVGRACREPAQDRPFESADILAFAADHGAARVSHFVDLAGKGALRARQREHRQPGNVEHRGFFVAGIGDANIQGSLDRVVADIRRVMAGAAESRDARSIEIIVKAGNSRDVDLGVVEDFLASRNRPAMLTHHAALMIVMAPVVGRIDVLE